MHATPTHREEQPALLHRAERTHARHKAYHDLVIINVTDTHKRHVWCDGNITRVQKHWHGCVQVAEAGDQFERHCHSLQAQEISISSDVIA